MNTPRELGFVMPAEWEQHSAVWLSWPHNIKSFPHLEKAEAAFADFIAAIGANSEPVELCVTGPEMRARAEALLAERGVRERVRFHVAEYEDIWIRDYGPSFVVNRNTKELAMTKWRYNAYGEKYPELLKDNEIPYRMNEELKLRMFEPGIVLEGGSIEVNGNGTVLTTTQCLLNPNRNPNLSKTDLERYLADYIGVPNIIWLSDGVEGDDTDGHVDDIARFVNPTTVVCVTEQDPNAHNYAALRENLALLQRAKDQDGKPLTVVPLPMPGVIETEAGEPLPASYANFYIGNNTVIVPTFESEHDEEALTILRPLFPGRRVIGINARFIVYGSGTFHCMTQQQPV